MEEIFNIFDESYTKIGIANRDEVHKNGFWHETFHCWFYYRDATNTYLYFQQRSETKKDYGGLFDITAAGHLLSKETIRDGVREVKEELGVEVDYSDLHYLGYFPLSIMLPDIIDNEFTNIFVLENKFSLDDFTIQEEEVQGIYEVPVPELEMVINDKYYETQVNGFTMIDGKRQPDVKTFSRSNLCAFCPDYYAFLIESLHKLK